MKGIQGVGQLIPLFITARKQEKILTTSFISQEKTKTPNHFLQRRGLLRIIHCQCTGLLSLFTFLNKVPDSNATDTITSDLITIISSIVVKSKICYLYY